MHLRALGEYMRKHQLPSFQPFFRTRDMNGTESNTVGDTSVSPETIQKMIDFGVFKLKPIEIPVSTHSSMVSIDLHLAGDWVKSYPSNGLPISGFPRNLFEEDVMRRASKICPYYGALA